MKLEKCPPPRRISIGVPKETSASRNALSAAEQQLLERHERVLRRGLGTFFEVGSSLLAIRDRRLYRAEYATFDAYCRERWGFGRTYAWRVIGAAERLKLLPSGDESPKPTSEFQMRPFLRLEPQEFPRAWKRVLAGAKDGHITSAIIREHLGGWSHAPKRHRTRRGAGFSKECHPGEILSLLQDLRRQINAAHSEPALAAVDRIEYLLFQG